MFYINVRVDFQNLPGESGVLHQRASWTQSGHTYQDRCTSPSQTGTRPLSQAISRGMGPARPLFLGSWGPPHEPVFLIDFPIKNIGIRLHPYPEYIIRGTGVASHPYPESIIRETGAASHPYPESIIRGTGAASHLYPEFIIRGTGAANDPDSESTILRPSTGSYQMLVGTIPQIQMHCRI